MRHRAAAFLMAAILMLSALPRASATNGLIKTTASIGGKTANLVYIEMGGARTILPAIANGSLSTDAPASDIIKSADADENVSVVAAINGGYFNSYYKAGALTVPENYPRIYSTIVADGQVANAGGTINAVGITYAGEVYIDRVTIKPTVTFDGDITVTAWGVNVFYADANAVSFFTDAFDYAVNVPAGAKIVLVKDHAVTSVTDGGRSFTVPNGYQAVVYNASAYANATKWRAFPAAGYSAVFGYTSEPMQTEYVEAWKEMRTVMAGGTLLVQNGADVSAEYSDESVTKLQNDAIGQRSFIAQFGDGRLLMGTCVSSFALIAKYLCSIGATNAVSMDGGASSMLYTSSDGFVTPAGRELATVLIVSDETKPAEKEAVTVKEDAPSSWALSAVERARDLGVLYEELDCKYQRNITRLEFCNLIAGFLRAKTGSSIEYYCKLQGITDSQLSEYTFTDTNGYYVKYCAALGFITGRGNGLFDPDSEILRQDAATILRRVAVRLGAAEPNAAAEPTFDDRNSISSYALDAVDYVATLRIMNGTGRNFAPANKLTREQAVVTLMNAMDAVQ